jgi:hypothetical protein
VFADLRVGGGSGLGTDKRPQGGASDGFHGQAAGLAMSRSATWAPVVQGKGRRGSDFMLARPPCNPPPPKAKRFSERTRAGRLAVWECPWAFPFHELTTPFSPCLLRTPAMIQGSKLQGF